MVIIGGPDDLRELVLAIIGKCPSTYTIGKHLHTHAKRISCINMLYDRESQEIIQRYLYCQRYNIQPFPGAYDDQPAWWMDMEAVIHNERNEMNSG